MGLQVRSLAGVGGINGSKAKAQWHFASAFINTLFWHLIKLWLIHSVVEPIDFLVNYIRSARSVLPVWLHASCLSACAVIVTILKGWYFAGTFVDTFRFFTLFLRFIQIRPAHAAHIFTSRHPWTPTLLQSHAIIDGTRNIWQVINRARYIFIN